ncbi:Na+/H+ antiporter NhaC family protein [bacterium]|nr:Na+/H+ antiporter NhaC family protein [bacterium]
MELEKKRNPWALIPFLVFLTLYFSIGIYLAIQGTDYAFYQFPAASCAMIAFAVALLMRLKNVHEQVEIFLHGISDKNVIIMLLIFLLAGAFAAVTKKMGGVDSTVNMGLSFIPHKMILPSLFLISCFISLAMGTSMGTIGAVAPIAIGLASAVGLPMALTMGAVLGGAMFGDNLSIISDTTIAATATQGCDMRSKFRMNFKIVIPAAVIVFLMLWFVSNPQTAPKEYTYSFIKTVPYILVLVTAISGVNVIAVLMLGIFSSIGIGFATNSVAFIELGKTINDGFMSMTDVIFMAFFAAGLAQIAAEEGGLSYLLYKLRRLIKGKRRAEIGIAGLVSVADMCTANNTIAIVITGKMAKGISNQYNISAPRTASLLDIFASVWQGIIPYGAQLLLIGGLSKLSPFEIIPYAWYPFALFVAGTLAIIFKFPREKTHMSS